MKHVVMFSGGIASWAAATRVAKKHGTENLTLLFTDTLMSMTEFRERVESEGCGLLDKFDLKYDVGGCGCFSDAGEDHRGT